MNAKVYDQFRKAVERQLETWNAIRDLEVSIEDDNGKVGSADDIGLDDAIRQVASGCDLTYEAKKISDQAIEDVLKGLLPDPDEKGGAA